MGVVIAFPVCGGVGEVTHHPEYDTRINENLPKDRIGFLKWANSALPTEDYVSMLEGIACYEVFVDLDEDLQTLVLGFINLKT